MIFDLGRSAEIVIAASVTDLHASENCRAHNDQSFRRLAGIAGPGVARRIRVPAEDSLAARRDIPGLRNTQFDSAKKRIRVEYRLIFRQVRIAQIDFNSTEQRLQLSAAKFLRVYALLYSAKNGMFVQCGERVGIVCVQCLAHFPSLQSAPHGKCSSRDQKQWPQFSEREMTVT